MAKDRGLGFTMVDVGASHGVRELAGLAPFTTVYAFEPNPQEYRKLAEGRSVPGGGSPAYRQVFYQPYAIGGTCGTGQLHVTRSPMACGLLEPDLERLREIRWKGRPYPPNFGDSFFQVLRTEPVQVRTLEWFADDQKVRHVDYLKVDVEGSEYDVLAGAGRLLDATGVIKVEVCFIPFRKGQRLFSEVDLLLRGRGFDLLRYEVLPAQVGYKERLYSDSHAQSLGFPDPHGQPLQADAMYVNRCVQGPERALAQALVLIEKGYLDEALFVLKRKAPGADPELLRLLATYRGTARRRALEAALWAYRTLGALPRRLLAKRDR